MNASWRGDQRPLREMIEGRVERRLAAILAVDVAGYSRLMGEDEEGTLGALRFAVNQMQTVALICGAVPNAGQAPEEGDAPNRA
jgi:class 3 adenylate cyclase